MERHPRALLTLSQSDGIGFRSNIPVSELIERNTRAVKASVVSSAPPVAETENGVTRESRPALVEPHGARGLELPDPRLEGRGSKAGSRKARGRLMSNKEPRGKTWMSLNGMCPPRLEADKAISTFLFDPSL